MLYFLYSIGLTGFLIYLRRNSTNPFIIDIILSIFWPVIVVIIFLVFIGLIIYNLIEYVAKDIKKLKGV